MAHVFNTNTWEEEANGSLKFNASLVYIGVPGQLGIHSETLSQKPKNKVESDWGRCPILTCGLRIHLHIHTVLECRGIRKFAAGTR